MRACRKDMLIGYCSNDKIDKVIYNETVQTEIRIKAIYDEDNNYCYENFLCNR